MRFDLTPNAAETPELLADRLCRRSAGNDQDREQSARQRRIPQPSGRSSGQACGPPAGRVTERRPRCKSHISSERNRAVCAPRPPRIPCSSTLSAAQGCCSVKRGCETANCGLCTVFLDDKPVLSCSVLAARADGHRVTTLEGLQDEAAEFARVHRGPGRGAVRLLQPRLRDERPGPVAGEARTPPTTRSETYLAGNLCRCSGYEGQLRGIRAISGHRKRGRRPCLEHEQTCRHSRCAKRTRCSSLLGKPVYMDDRRPARTAWWSSCCAAPTPNALDRRPSTPPWPKRCPASVAIYTWEDVAQNAAATPMAGQTYPEPCPYDRLILDQHVRFVGDAGGHRGRRETEKAVDKAMKLIKVEYRGAGARCWISTPPRTTPSWSIRRTTGKACAPWVRTTSATSAPSDECGSGDVDAVLADCDVVIDHVYHTKACQPGHDGDLPHLLPTWTSTAV